MQQIFEVVCNMLLLVEVFFVLHYCKNKNTEQDLLHQQERFLGETAVQYTKVADLKEAIREGIRSRDHLMEEEAWRLLDSLEKESLSTVMEYLAQVKNSFFTVFYAMCHTVKNLGDLYQNGQSLFVKNIQYIEEEVRMEILRFQNAGYLFRGLMGLCVIPFFLMPMIEMWAISIGSGMEEYFEGSYGVGTTLFCYLFSALCLLLVLWLHYPDLRVPHGYRIEIRILQNRWIRYFVDGNINKKYSKYLKKNEELKKLQGFGNIQQFMIRKYLCMLKGISLSIMMYLLVLFAERTQKYTGIRFQMFFILSILAGGIVGYILPELELNICRWNVEQKKMEETLRFQTMILILRNYPQMTVEDLLGWLESFAELFRSALAQAVDSFSYDRKRSLEQLREDAGYEPVGRIADAFISCDEVRISDAFLNMESERNYYMDQYRQKVQAWTRERAALAKVVAYLPFITILALKLIVPFVMQGLNQMAAYSDSLKTMM